MYYVGGKPTFIPVTYSPLLHLVADLQHVSLAFIQTKVVSKSYPCLITSFFNAVRGPGYFCRFPCGDMRVPSKSEGQLVEGRD